MRGELTGRDELLMLPAGRCRSLVPIGTQNEKERNVKNQKITFGREQK
jgi:hypothetical protein